MSWPLIGPNERHSRWVNACPATNFVVSASSVGGGPERGEKFSGLESGNDGFFFDADACGSKATICSFGEAVGEKMGLHGKFKVLQ